MRRRVVAAVLLVTAFAGCKEKKGADVVEKKSADVVALDEFKQFAGKFAQALQESYSRPIAYPIALTDGKEGTAQLSYQISGSYSLDVRKTDSLVSPFEGILTFLAEADGTYEYSPGKKEPDIDARFHGNLVIRFAYQDGKWIYQAAEQIGTRGARPGVTSRMISKSARIRSAVDRALGP